MTEAEIKTLVEKALEVRKNAYSPYYEVFVGSALLAKNGKTYVGCNVENAAGPAITCAETAALGAAVADGQRSFRAVAVIGLDEKFLYPCGLCLQRLSEFAPDLDVYVANVKGEINHHPIRELLPHPARI